MSRPPEANACKTLLYHGLLLQRVPPPPTTMAVRASTRPRRQWTGSALPRHLSMLPESQCCRREYPAPPAIAVLLGNEQPSLAHLQRLHGSLARRVGCALPPVQETAAPLFFCFDFLPEFRFRHERGVAAEPRHVSVQRYKSDAKTTSSSATCNTVYDYISGMRQVPHRQDRDRPETTNP